MNEDEFDRILAEKIKAGLSGKRLSAAFRERLVLSVRRRRRAFRMKLVAGIGLLAALGVVCAGVARSMPPQRNRTPQLVATDGQPKDSQLGGWMLISCIRECFRRARAAKRKDE